jgi:hypothetical protein
MLNCNLSLPYLVNVFQISQISPPLLSLIRSRPLPLSFGLTQPRLLPRNLVQHLTCVSPGTDVDNVHSEVIAKSSHVVLGLADHGAPAYAPQHALLSLDNAL